MPKFHVKNGMVIGQITCDRHGYRYLPFNSAHRASRKSHTTPEGALKGRPGGGRLVEAANIAEASIIAKGGNPV